MASHDQRSTNWSPRVPVSAICDEFECYGYRGTAPPRHGDEWLKVQRLVREHGLQLKRRRRYVATTESDHA